MIWGQVSLSQSFEFDHVPLSCVPPITSHDLDGLIATLMNCSVLPSLLSMWSSRVGTRDNSRAQFARLAAASSGRSFELQRDEMSLNVPLVRIIPPSEPSQILVGLDGLTAITCWSGWIEFGAQRHWNGAVTPPNVSWAPSSEHQV